MHVKVITRVKTGVGLIKEFAITAEFHQGSLASISFYID